MTLAVSYGAKSTEDKKGSIPTQLADCRAAAEAEGREIVAEYQDESASAYRGNRGQGLTDAKEHAIRLGAELWVQHSDRVARGDGITADHLAEVWFALRRAGVRMRSVQDDHNLDDAIRVVLIGERNNEDSDRKAAATRAGHARRAAKGLPMGFIPVGYKAVPVVDEHGQTKLRRDGKAETERVLDSERAALVERIMGAIEVGHSFGQVSRMLNAEGLRTNRGGEWTTRAVRRVVMNEDYTGTTGYPVIIERVRWQAIQDRLKRLDPVTVQARKGGRPAPEDFLLHGLVFCLTCGSPLRVRRYRGGTRVYRCRNVFDGRALCDAAPVRADLAESHVMAHFDRIIGEELASWAAQRASEHESEHRRKLAVVERKRKQLVGLERQRNLAAAQHLRLLDADDDLADTALRQLAGIESQITECQRAIADAEARAAEFADAPEQDTVFEYINGLVDLVCGRVSAASGSAEVNAVLREALVGIWMAVDDGAFRAEFRLQSPDAASWLTFSPSDDMASMWVYSDDESGERTEDVPAFGSAWSKPNHTHSCTTSRSARRSPRRRARVPSRSAPSPRRA
jgi:site-specific DNA recombinase